ncbi:MAG: peptidylprolyl isomerase [Oscillospiraceae bacterium]|jgi:hypothetical protein
MIRTAATVLCFMLFLVIIGTVIDSQLDAAAKYGDAGFSANAAAASYNPYSEDSDAMFRRLLNLDEDDVLLVVAGENVTVGYFCYWIIYIIENYYNGSVDWTKDVGGISISEYLKAMARDVAAARCNMERTAREKGIVLTEDDIRSIDAQISQFKNYYGAKAWEEGVKSGIITEGDYTEDQKKAWIENCGSIKFSNLLTSMAVSMDGYISLCRGDLYSKYLVDYLFGEGGAFKPSEEDLKKFIEDNQIFCAKQIFISAQKEDGSPISAEESARALRRAQEIRAQLRAGGDKEEDFTRLMHECSEDPGLPEYPNGYTYRKGSMIGEFESAVERLEVGAVSDIVESDLGYHIIMRLTAVNEDTKLSYIHGSYQKLLDSWLSSVGVEETEAFISLDIQDFCEKLEELRNELNAG